MSVSTRNTSHEDSEGRPPRPSRTPEPGDTEETIVLYPKGDLVLRIGAKFVVCSRRLAEASPFFRALLFGSFAEAQHEPGSSWVVDLPDDCPGSMGILLALVHGRTDHLTCTLPTAEVEAFLAQADKYDLWLDPNMDIRSCGDKCS
ncbi:hypothetical protein LX36DRAFT_712822 [Colletotrichum falcatum]|nr:hypothetical protein LX36DRAFT_712822 [Colletotrichum falcatum]